MRFQTMAKTVGLTLGKFAPLHKGHQFLIEAARARVDHLIVMIYACPDLIAVPLETRAGWIRALYPDVEVILAPDGPEEVGDTPEIKARQEAYIGQRLAGRQISHFFSSEFYGAHVSRFLGAKDCRVDEARQRFPVSGTLVRGDPFGYRQWLDPLVYRDLITRVVFLGAPSTGKTTLAEAVAARFSTCWMPEYGREYWQQFQTERRLTPQQMVEIAQGHRQREEALLAQANRFLFVDTNALTTLQFARYYHGDALEPLQVLADACKERYPVVFLCDDDIAYDDTWDRSGEVNRRAFQQQIEQDLIARQIPYTLLSGDLESRVQRVAQYLLPVDQGHGVSKASQ